MPKIIIQHPDGTSAKFGLNGRAFTIGRADNNDIVLRDGSSSGSHAILKLTDDGDFAVTDLESTNFTKVNGVAVSTRILRHGDTVQFAETHATYESDVVARNEDQATQVYERVRAAPAPAPHGQPGAKPVYVIQRPVSTMGGSRRSNPDSGCFTVLMLCVLVPALFIAGVIVRHFQDNKSEWVWNYVREHLSKTP